MTSSDVDETRLSYWFPAVQAAGLPVPSTELVLLDAEQAEDLLGVLDGRQSSALDYLVAAIAARVPRVGGVPFFLRTDYTSAKHQWNETCCVRELNQVGRHVYRLVEHSALADMFGLPADVFVVRELLRTRPAFYAFDGLPISREFRFFVRDGVVEHWQPYWPPDSIERPSSGTWRQDLDRISLLQTRDVNTLTDLSVRVNRAVPGYWSVDWLETRDRGWMLTDMAEGDKSFKWEA